MAGQIINRGDKKWVIRIFLGRDSNGKRKYFNHTLSGTKKDAQKYLTQKLREKDLGEFIESSALSLSEYLDNWLESAAKPRLRPQTYESYKYHLKKYIRPELGATRLSNLKAIHIQKLYFDLQEQSLGSRVIRYSHAILNSALNQAIKWQIISTNPCLGVELPRHQRREMLVLSPEEVTEFLSECKENKHSLIFGFALATGMRPSEYFGLQWQNVDFENGVVRVRKALVWKTGGGWDFGDPKTERSRRVVPLPKTLLNELKTHRIEQQKNRLKLGPAYQNSDLVFATEFGTPLNARNIDQRHFKKILKKVGLNEKIRLYDLRHTCATLLLSAGENPKIVSERLGHASIVLTLDTYSHVLPDMQKAATEKLEKMLFG
jgi:integrase